MAEKKVSGSKNKAAGASAGTVKKTSVSSAKIKGKGATIRKAKGPRIAVFIDIDNTNASRDNVLEIISILQTKGSIVYGKIYGYADDKTNEFGDIIAEHKLETIGKMRFGAEGIGGIDPRLMIEIVEICQRNKFDLVFVWAGIGDMIPIFSRIKGKVLTVDNPIFDCDNKFVHQKIKLFSPYNSGRRVAGQSIASANVGTASGGIAPGSNVGLSGIASGIGTRGSAPDGLNKAPVGAGGLSAPSGIGGGVGGILARARSLAGTSPAAPSGVKTEVKTTFQDEPKENSKSIFASNSIPQLPRKPGAPAFGEKATVQQKPVEDVEDDEDDDEFDLDDVDDFADEDFDIEDEFDDFLDSDEEIIERIKIDDGENELTEEENKRLLNLSLMMLEELKTKSIDEISFEKLDEKVRQQTKEKKPLKKSDASDFGDITIKVSSKQANSANGKADKPNPATNSNQSQGENKKQETFDDFGDLGTAKIKKTETIKDKVVEKSDISTIKNKSASPEAVNDKKIDSKAKNEDTPKAKEKTNGGASEDFGDFGDI